MSQKIDDLAEAFALDLCKLIAGAYIGTGWKWGWLNGTIWVYRVSRHSIKALKRAGKRGETVPEALEYMLCSMEIKKKKIIVTGGDNYRIQMLKEAILRRDSPVNTKRKNFKIVKDDKEWGLLFVTRTKKTYEKWGRIIDEETAKGGTEKEIEARLGQRLVEEFSIKELRQLGWGDMADKKMRWD